MMRIKINNKKQLILKSKMMEKLNLNVQVLSEKEMRKVKGGKSFTVKEPTAKFCPYCGRQNVNPVMNTNYVYLCMDCGNGFNDDNEKK